MTVSRTQVIQRLREAGFVFKEKAKHAEMWRKRGSVERVFVNLREQFDEQMVTVTLSQAGLTRQQINEFLAACVKS